MAQYLNVRQHGDLPEQRTVLREAAIVNYDNCAEITLRKVPDQLHELRLGVPRGDQHSQPRQELEVARQRIPLG